MRPAAEEPAQWLFARMEGQIALAVPEARIEWLNSMVFRGMKTLPLDVSR